MCKQIYVTKAGPNTYHGILLRTLRCCLVLLTLVDLPDANIHIPRIEVSVGIFKAYKDMLTCSFNFTKLIDRQNLES